MEYFALFVIGLLGSIGHCAGMCGGFVSAYSLKLPQTGNLIEGAKPHLLFNSGRLFTYMLLGILFGAAGQTAAIALGFADLQASIRLFAGAAMIIIALQATGLLRQLHSINPGSLLFKLMRHLRPNSPLKLMASGSIIGLMPCGLVYAAGAQALTAGTVIEASLQMTAFGVGTIPTLLFIGLGVNKLSAQKRIRIFRGAAVLVILMGMFSIYRGGQELLTPDVNTSTVSNCLTIQPAEAK